MTKPSFTTIAAELGEFTVELLKVVLISLAIILPIRYYVVQPFYVKGASMEPTFFNREYLLIDELSYQFAEVKRGEVVVFRYPRDTSQFFIKRVVGMPGDTVHISNGNVRIVNDDYPQGLLLAEPYLQEPIATAGDYEVEVKEGYYFLLGDNRSASLDSRVFGPVAERHVIGRVWLRAWPITKWAAFDRDEIPLPVN